MPIRSKVVSSVVKARIVPSKRITADTLTLKGPVSITDIADFDLSGLSDGCILIYDEATQKFKVTRFVDNNNLTVFGGTF
jgi:hypothetical protein